MCLVFQLVIFLVSNIDECELDIHDRLVNAACTGLISNLLCASNSGFECIGESTAEVETDFELGFSWVQYRALQLYNSVNRH